MDEPTIVVDSAPDPYSRQVEPQRHLALGVRLGRDFLPLVILVALILAARIYVIQNFAVAGTSMMPNLHDKDRLLVDVASYGFRSPTRGDIIILHPPIKPGDDYVKRVIGLPGNSVKICNGQVWINGKRLSEPYIKSSFTYSWPDNYCVATRTVPPHSLFVLGDNRDVSDDSHIWTNSQGRATPFLADKNIVGRVILSYWPLTDLHFFLTPN